MIYYYPTTEEFIIINHKFCIYEIISHEELDRLEMMKDRNPPFGEYELRQMFPTRYPQQRHAFSDNKITDDDIQRAKLVPISNFISVPKYGNMKCPFHNDGTASFHVYTAKNRWYCFGECNKGGDVIELYMILKKTSFKETVKELIK